MERCHCPLRRHNQVCLYMSLSLGNVLTASSFAHVSVNAPEAYVKPTVLEKGEYTVLLGYIY